MAENDRFLHFFSACERGDLLQVQTLLPSIGQINRPNEQGWNAIIVAAFNQHHDVVRFLLENGADVNSRNRNGTTVLMYAKTKAADFELLNLLLDAGADVNARDIHGLTVLDYVYRSGRHDLATFLASHGAVIAEELKPD